MKWKKEKEEHFRWETLEKKGHVKTNYYQRKVDHCWNIAYKYTDSMLHLTVN